MHVYVCKSARTHAHTHTHTHTKVFTIPNVGGSKYSVDLPAARPNIFNTLELVIPPIGYAELHVQHATG